MFLMVTFLQALAGAPELEPEQNGQTLKCSKVAMSALKSMFGNASKTRLLPISPEKYRVRNEAWDWPKKGDFSLLFITHSSQNLFTWTLEHPFLAHDKRSNHILMLGSFWGVSKHLVNRVPCQDFLQRKSPKGLIIALNNPVWPQNNSVCLYTQFENTRNWFQSTQSYFGAFQSLAILFRLKFWSTSKSLEKGNH